MKKYNKIKKIITEHFGLTSLEDYKTWLEKWISKEYIPTKKDIALLHPDNISCRP